MTLASPDTTARGPDRPISVTDMFTIGIGPSSSHTVGPMRAALAFAREAVGYDVQRVLVEIYGSLALTGKGHATDHALILGLAGHDPGTIDPDAVSSEVARIRASGRIALGGTRDIAFDEAGDLLFKMGEFLPRHPNALRFRARCADGVEFCQTWYSVGGGVIVLEDAAPALLNIAIPYGFGSAAELLEIGRERGMSIADILIANEASWRSPAELDGFLDSVRAAMASSIERGSAQEGILPGGLKVKRRAAGLHRKLTAQLPRVHPSMVFDWVSLWALAVNEENAAGGRVVTAPTNGAAGVIPAVLRYYQRFTDAPTEQGERILLITAAAIGMLYKKRASISAAEMGCQGEVGVACSMAAAGLAAALGGSNEQVENAAEIGMEHNLGLTCDPIGGLVQIPCIERNAMGAIKAINAAHLALQGDGTHVVSLDAVIETMRQTGEDMRTKYKETSLGGLAVNVVEC